MEIGTEYHGINTAAPLDENHRDRAEFRVRTDREDVDPMDGFTIYKRQEPTAAWALWLFCGFAVVVSVAVLLSSVNRSTPGDLAGSPSPTISEGLSVMEGSVVTTSEASE